MAPTNVKRLRRSLPVPPPPLLSVSYPYYFLVTRSDPLAPSIDSRRACVSNCFAVPATHTHTRSYLNHAVLAHGFSIARVGLLRNVGVAGFIRQAHLEIIHNTSNPVVRTLQTCSLKIVVLWSSCCCCWLLLLDGGISGVRTGKNRWKTRTWKVLVEVNEPAFLLQGPPFWGG